MFVCVGGRRNSSDPSHTSGLSSEEVPPSDGGHWRLSTDTTENAAETEREGGAECGCRQEMKGTSGAGAVCTFILHQIYEFTQVSKH